MTKTIKTRRIQSLLIIISTLIILAALWNALVPLSQSFVVKSTFDAGKIQGFYTGHYTTDPDVPVVRLWPKDQLPLLKAQDTIIVKISKVSKYNEIKKFRLKE